METEFSREIERREERFQEILISKREEIDRETELKIGKMKMILTNTITQVCQRYGEGNKDIYSLEAAKSGLKSTFEYQTQRQKKLKHELENSSNLDTKVQELQSKIARKELELQIKQNEPLFTPILMFKILIFMLSVTISLLQV